MSICAIEAVEDVLRSHIDAGHGRFRGIRQSCSWDADPGVLGPLHGRVPEGLYRDANFRRGFKVLHKLGLSFDAWLLEPQLPDLIDLARAFPDTTIVCDHVGTPLGIAAYEGKRDERFGVWRDNIRELAKCQNVNVKLGGLPMPFAGWRKRMAEPLPTSETLAAQWKPYIDTCIEAFGAIARHVREQLSRSTASARTTSSLWNAFKRLAANYSASEKTALFSGTAARVYRVNLT